MLSGSSIRTRRSVLRKTPCRVGRQYKGFASLATGLQAACSPLDFLLRSANVSTLMSVSDNEREYHCSRQKVRLRHCRPPCSIRCRVASVACSSCKKPSPLSLRPSASGFHKKSIPLLLQGKAPPCHITGLSPGLTRNKVLRMEISFGKLQYLALELVSLNPPRPSLSCLEIAPSSQLTFEERGIGHSAGRRSRPAQ